MSAGTTGYLLDAASIKALRNLLNQVDPVSTPTPHPPSSQGAGLRPYLLEMTSGFAGSGTVPCSFVYTIKTLDGYTLKTEAPVLWARPLRKMIAATHGACFVDGDGELKIAFCDEVIDGKVCT